MTPQHQLYILAALGYVLMIASKAWKREENSFSRWFGSKNNLAFMLFALVLVAATMMIGPGDDADLSSTMARTWAFGIAVTVSEAASAIVYGPPSMSRRAAK